MSLTSRISNLFSSNQASHLAPADGHNHQDIDRSLGVSIDHGAILEARTDPKRRHEVDEEVEEEEEEEGRPPYLHVRGCVVSNRYSIAAYLTDHAVDVGWWNRRHDWRSLDALDRYSQNAATGRHPHSPKVPNLILRIHHHRPSGRYPARSV